MRNDRGHTEDALDAQEERTGILLAISTIFTDTKTWTIGLTLLDYCYSPQASVFARHAYARLRTPFGRALCIALLFCTPSLPGSYGTPHICTILHLLPFGLPHRRSRILHLRISASPFRTYCTRTCMHSCSIAPAPRTARTPTSRTVRMDRYQYIRITRVRTCTRALALTLGKYSRAKNTLLLKLRGPAATTAPARDSFWQDPKLSFSTLPRAMDLMLLSTTPPPDHSLSQVGAKAKPLKFVPSISRAMASERGPYIVLQVGMEEHHCGGRELSRHASPACLLVASSVALELQLATL